MKKHTRYSLGLIAVIACLAAMPVLAMDPTGGMPKTEKIQTASSAAQQSAFSQKDFMAAQDSGMPFIVAFHKKGCPLCVKQQRALNHVYTKPAHMNLRVLVVEYPNDIQNLEAFDVSKQGTLIVFEGDKEVSRTQGLIEASDIEKQLRG
jgi:hypothetical protein